MIRSRLGRKPRERSGQRCPACKLGTLEDAGEVMVEVAPGWSWPVSGRHLRCPRCGAVRPKSASDRRAADELAYAQHRKMILERDGHRCQRERDGRKCGRAAWQVAHDPGWSRAQNPGPTKHDPCHLHACCDECHDEEHTGAGRRKK